MRIKVEAIIVEEGMTVGLGIGTTDDGTVDVLFGGDARMMSTMKSVLEDPETVELIAEVPEWAVLAHRERGTR